MSKNNFNDHKHIFDDPDPTDDFEVTIKGIEYHEVIGEQCTKCEAVRLFCFKKSNENIVEPDQVYLQKGYGNWELLN